MAVTIKELLNVLKPWRPKVVTSRRESLGGYHLLRQGERPAQPDRLYLGRASGLKDWTPFRG